jgi:hypothetical protein
LLDSAEKTGIYSLHFAISNDLAEARQIADFYGERGIAVSDLSALPKEIIGRAAKLADQFYRQGGAKRSPGSLTILNGVAEKINQWRRSLQGLPYLFASILYWGTVILGNPYAAAIWEELIFRAGAWQLFGSWQAWLVYPAISIAVFIALHVIREILLERPSNIVEPRIWHRARDYMARTLILTAL